MRSIDAFVIIPTLTTSGLRKKFAFFSTTLPDLISGLGMQTDPLFPGSVPITDDDKVTCERQTGQQAPSNALLGKPLHCNCKHGYPQAFSLDPIPPTQQFKRSSMDRVNSGLLKLTCPLLVTAIDLIEDEGHINKINSKLTDDVEGDGNKLSRCMNKAHAIHSSSRKKLVFGSATIDDKAKDGSQSYQILLSKLGQRGAEYFLDSGVAGANPLSKKQDVKCLHAWIADYLFRNVSSEDDCGDGMTTVHPIGEAILETLSDKGLDVTGTETCYQVCSGVEGGEGALTIPIPRNKQRKKRGKRRQLKESDQVE